MSEVLSQSQIDKLLSNYKAGRYNEHDYNNKEKSNIREFNFKSPKRITKENIKTLNSIYENYARSLSTYFTANLRLFCDVVVEQIEESRFYEFNNALNDYVLMGLVDVNTADDKFVDGQILMEISKPLSFFMIDKLLGGSGKGYEYDRDYTDIELSIFNNMFSQLISLMQEAWSNTVLLKTNFERIETNSRLIKSISYNDTVIIIILSVSVNGLSEKINLCIPTVMLEEIFKSANNINRNNKRKIDEEQLENDKQVIMESLKKSELDVVGILGTTEISLNELINIQVGDVITLNTHINDQAEIKIEDEVWFKGKWGTKNNNNAIKIDKLIH